MSLIGLTLIRTNAGWWACAPDRLGFACAVTAAFAVLGYLVRGVSRSGAVAGAVACFALFAAVGPGALAALFFLFVVTWLTTRIGRGRKERLGTAESGAGRNAAQVVANLGVASACAVLYGFRGQPAFLAAMAAALAEAAADTVSSEFGQACSESARLITTLETVPGGTNGGITAAGTFAGGVAAALVSVVCMLAGLLTRFELGIAAACGVLGMLLDSFLGAGLERRGRLTNDAVNLLSTGAAAAMAGLFVLLVV